MKFDTGCPLSYSHDPSRSWLAVPTQHPQWPMPVLGWAVVVVEYRKRGEPSRRLGKGIAVTDVVPMVMHSAHPVLVLHTDWAGEPYETVRCTPDEWEAALAADAEWWVEHQREMDELLRGRRETHRETPAP